MVSFASDYTTGAHPEILKKLGETNLEPLSGYGTDLYCDSAKQKIRKTIGKEELDVEFLVGGTQTNALIISSMLQEFEGVIAAETGHINVHESGAVEYTGHKVIALPEQNGKIAALDLANYLETFYEDETYEHMVIPGMVYISHPTEYGTLYSKKELEDISEVCKKYDLRLFMDGARLGYGLVSKQTDVTLKDIAEFCDVFYIGGTKVGAICGEAVVFTKNNKPKHFTAYIKQHGALLAKGRLLGIQFDTLFTDDLYFKISTHAMEMADQLKEIFKQHGMEFFIDSPTNQQFVTVENTLLDAFEGKVAYTVWSKPDKEHTVLRFVTSWSTTKEDLEVLESCLG
ncbi:MAG: low specificity L-threonine aldolase [Lachnospiraceae bacterium]|nr:low specificity L-threonine aldolase [Lachnospiraceae bacterium]